MPPSSGILGTLRQSAEREGLRPLEFETIDLRIDITAFSADVDYSTACLLRSSTSCRRGLGDRIGDEKFVHGTAFLQKGWTPQKL